MQERFIFAISGPSKAEYSVVNLNITKKPSIVNGFPIFYLYDFYIFYILLQTFISFTMKKAETWES